MTDISFALEAKSDQLNAVDIMAAERVIKIRGVEVHKGEQPVSVYFDGDNNKPWKPCKGMLRILAASWGQDSSAWVGRSAQLFYEPTVMYGGKEVGGIRVRALSDINPKGMNFSLAINRGKREPYPVKLLTVDTRTYPADKFDGAFDAMVSAMRDDGKSLQSVIAQCQKTGQLTADQLARLEAAAPIENDEAPEVFSGTPDDSPI